MVNVTFIYSSRWISAGWLTPLDDYIRDPNKTPADWDVDDFLPGPRAPETGKDGKLYGIPWIVDAFIAASARFDLFKDDGLACPTRSTSWSRRCRPSTRRTAWPASSPRTIRAGPSCPILQAFGGNVFRNPPDDLMPTLDTPGAVAAAEYFAQAVNDFGPDGAHLPTPRTR